MSMQPVHLYAALLDVLAYKQRLERDRNLGILDFQNQLTQALRILEGVNEVVFQTQAISDTIILTCCEHGHFPEFLNILRQVFIAFLKQGLFVRGGVAYSRHFSNKSLTYSHAIARAYELEQSMARYPRIVIDKNIFEMYVTGEGLPKIEQQGLLYCENGVYSLQILTRDNWMEVYSSAKKLYKGDGEELKYDDGAFAKHLRFQRYLLSSPYAITGHNEYIDGIIDV